MSRESHSGLSPSSLTLFMGCARKYYLKKIVRAPIDPDQAEDTTALNIGKAFHKVLEDKQHDLTNVKFSEVFDTVGYFLDPVEYTPMIFAMLRKYKIMHESSRLKAIACEVAIETPDFYGEVDVILQCPITGSWWIGDMKTAAAFTNMLPPTLPRHPQLNLYAHHADVLAKQLQLPLEKYRGCRYRLITKSKLIRKEEEIGDYVNRLSKVIKAYDFAIPKETMESSIIYSLHKTSYDFIQSNKDKGESRFAPNYGYCTQYFRPCEFWSKCHGKLHSEMQEIDVIESF